MTNRDVAGILSQFADLLDIKGESGFRVSAYRRAADTIKRLVEPVELLLQEDRLTDIKGIGKGLAAQIAEISGSGTLTDLEALQDEIPGTLLTILAIPGIGPKTVGRLYRERGVTNIEELEARIDDGSLVTRKGIGTKQISRVQEGIAFLRQRTGRLSIGTALPVARNISRAIGGSLGARAEVAGSVRRRCETAGNIDLLVESADLIAIQALLEQEFGLTSPTIEGDALSGELPGICPLRIVATPPDEWGTRLFQLTGSREHVAALESRSPNDSPQPEEEQIYVNAGIDAIPPELRENRGEIEAAESGTLPNLVELGQFRGDLHLHSTWSDGRATIEQLASRAIELGYSFLSIADHSHSLAIANGLDADRLKAQAEKIEAVNERTPELRLLRASEVEIRRDGTLDFPDEVLEQLDLVVASLHSGRSMSRDELTERLLNAIENPHVDIIAHPTGRIVEQRPGADYDWERVFEAAIRTRTALEINANPARLDLPEALARSAVEAGALIAINSDAHDLAGLDVMEFGVGIAHRGWVPARSVVNTWTLAELESWLAR